MIHIYMISVLYKPYEYFVAHLLCSNLQVECLKQLYMNITNLNNKKD